MTELCPLVQQDRNPFVVERLEFGVRIDVDDIDSNAELGGQRQQRQLHLVTEVAIAARDQRQRAQINQPFCRAAP